MQSEEYVVILPFICNNTILSSKSILTSLQITLEGYALFSTEIGWFTGDKET